VRKTVRILVTGTDMGDVFGLSSEMDYTLELGNETKMKRRKD